MTAVGHEEITEHVLVTGASGFIGSAIVKRLMQDGVRVTATARRATETLSQELGQPIAKLDVMGDLPEFDSVTTVVHCATPNDIFSKEDHGGLPLSVMGTRKLFEHAIAAGVKRFIFFSTIQVYGTELTGRITEKTEATCESLYGLNHYLGEEVCRHFARNSDVDVVAVRPSNVYGVPTVSTVDRWTLVPMCFVKTAHDEDGIVIRSSGKQRRNFVSMSEVADAVSLLVGDCPAGFSIANVGSNWDASIADIARLTAATMKQASGREISVQTLSDEPSTGNKFTYESNLVPSKLSPEQSKARMISTIEGLSDLYQRFA